MALSLQFFPRQRYVSIFFGTCLFSGTLSAQELETELWQVPMKIDRTDALTDMMLEFSFERIETPFSGYEPGQDPDRIAMDEFMQSVVVGDIEDALDRTDVPSGTSRENGRELLQAFNGMLSTTPDTLHIERVIHVGPDRLLLWSLPLETGGRFYRSFRFVRNNSEELQYEGVASEPISGLITNAFQVGQASGADDRDASEFTYDYVFPGTDEQPVFFRFDGEEIEVDAFNPLGETGNEVIDFFNESMNLLENNSADEYAARFTDFSENRYSAWAADQGTEAYEAYRSDMLQYGARVVFLLNAKPLHLVFFLPTDLDIKGNPLRYVPIYDNPETGLEIANFYVVGLADAILERREYFNEPFLRPLLINAGLISDEIEGEGIVASSGETIMPSSDEIMSEEDYIALKALTEDQAIDEPEIKSIDELASEDRIWPWVVGALAILVLATLATRRRK